MALESDRLRDADRIPEAVQAAQRAAALLPRSGGHAELSRAVEDRVADLRLLSRLEDARMTAAAVRSDKDAPGAERAGPLFRQAFHEFGSDVLSDDETAVIAALRPRAIAKQIVIAFVDWSRLTHDPGEKERLCRLAEALDADPRRIASRTLRMGLKNNFTVLKRLAVEAEADPPAPAVFVFLAEQFFDVPLPADGVRLLRVAQQRYPADFWINLHLADALEKEQTHAAEAIEYYRAAVALRPWSPGLRLTLGIALSAQKRYAEAAAVCRGALELKPDFAEAYRVLGDALSRMRQYSEAEAALRRAIEINPDVADAYLDLGFTLILENDVRGGIAAIQKAISHANSGNKVRPTAARPAHPGP